MTVLEARDRVGGRAWTVDGAGVPVDLGAHVAARHGRQPARRRRGLRRARAAGQRPGGDGAARPGWPAGRGRGRGRVRPLRPAAGRPRAPARPARPRRLDRRRARGGGAGGGGRGGAAPAARGARGHERRRPRPARAGDPAGRRAPAGRRRARARGARHRRGQPRGRRRRPARRGGRAGGARAGPRARHDDGRACTRRSGRSSPCRSACWPVAPSTSTRRCPTAVLDGLHALDPGAVTTVALRLEEPLAPAGVEFASLAADVGTWAVLDDAHESPVLVGWAVGDAAARLPDDDAAVVRDALGALARALGVPAPEPSWSAVVRWGDDPFALGARSFVPAGVDPGVRAALGGAVSARLLLAGEASSTEWPATVHGAVASGEREAQRCMTLCASAELGPPSFCDRFPRYIPAERASCPGRSMRQSGAMRPRKAAVEIAPYHRGCCAHPRPGARGGSAPARQPRSRGLRRRGRRCHHGPAARRPRRTPVRRPRRAGRSRGGRAPDLQPGQRDVAAGARGAAPDAADRRPVAPRRGGLLVGAGRRQQRAARLRAAPHRGRRATRRPARPPVRLRADARRPRRQPLLGVGRGAAPRRPRRPACRSPTPGSRASRSRIAASTARPGPAPRPASPSSARTASRASTARRAGCSTAPGRSPSPAAGTCCTASSRTSPTTSRRG